MSYDIRTLTDDEVLVVSGGAGAGAGTGGGKDNGTHPGSGDLSWIVNTGKKVLALLGL